MTDVRYESEKLLSEYLLLHYGGEKEIFDGLPGPREALNFPARCVHELIDALPPGARALDVGCAVGRATFELAALGANTIGVDYSVSFIRAARHIAQHGELSYSRVIEGQFTDQQTVIVPKDATVYFEVGDAMNLPTDLEAFDVVLACNLICRLSNPRKFLDHLPGIVKPGGQLLLATPFTWLKDFTPCENWLGGQSGKRSFDALKAILEPHFTLELTKDISYVIRESARKFQYGVSLGTRWRRR